MFDAEIGTEAFVTGAQDALPSGGARRTARRETPGGSIEATISLRAGAEEIVDQLMIAGDFFVTPPRVIADLEAHLRGRRLGQLASVAAAFLTANDAAFLGAAQSDMIAVIVAATQAANEATHG